MTPEQLAHALDPLKVVDAKALDEIADAMKESKSKQKRAVGVFLNRINRYRLAPGGNKSEAPALPDLSTELRDLNE